jgi:hexosaminidase
VLGLQANLWSENMRLESNMTRMAWPRAAALAEIAWTPADRLDWDDFSRRLKVQQKRYAALGLVDDDAAPRLDTHGHVYSQDLRLCTEKIALNLDGGDATYLVDIENPCWILPQADLSKPHFFTAEIGWRRFNFQLGKERDEIHMPPPHTPNGELTVRADGCDGKLIADMPVMPSGTGRLSAELPAMPGRHDLCLHFTGKDIDPLRMLNWIELSQ